MRDFTAEERQEARRLAGCGTASGGHQQPLALWVIGPSAVGKSTLTCEIAPEFGISRLHEEQVCSGPQWSLPGLGLDAVVVDGEFFREVHSSYQEWTASSDWAAAYPALKPMINAEKDEMLRDMANRRKHLVIPHTCLDLQACLATVQYLTDCGYTNHVIAVNAPCDEVARRGYAREIVKGKRYAPKEYERSVAAFVPMIRACNGRFQVLQAVFPANTVSAGDDVEGALCLDRHVLLEGQGGVEVTVPELHKPATS